jgi:hypothetical protein
VRREKERLEKQIEQEHRQLSNLIKENKKLPKDKDHQPRLEMDPLTETDEENEEEKETTA